MDKQGPTQSCPLATTMEEEDVNVVDVEAFMENFEQQASSSTAPLPDGQPRSMAEHARHSARLRSASQSTPPVPAPAEGSERVSTRASARPKIPPKFKFKLSEKAAAQAPGMSFLGQYDRELDSDDEELAFEEQFILRLPPGEDCDRLRKMVAAREVSNDIWFKFKGTLQSPI
jgi:transcription initiation factor TFIID subunit 7